MEREVFDEAVKQFREDAECGELVRKIMGLPHVGSSVSFVKTKTDGRLVFVVNRFPSEGAVEGETLQDAVSAAKGNK